MKFSSLSRIGLFILLVAVLLSACQAGKPTSEPCDPGPTGGICVSISDDTCPSVAVKVGQKLTLTNKGKQQQTIRVETLAGESKFTAEDLMPGDSFGTILLEAGSYTLICSEIQGTSSLTVEP